ncbi:hypothetical protein D3C80_2090590 [compost metagenome]
MRLQLDAKGLQEAFPRLRIRLERPAPLDQASLAQQPASVFLEAGKVEELLQATRL